MTAYKTHLKGLIILVILLASTAIAGSYAALQSETVPLEVKEPLEILAYNSTLSLYPGETLKFTVSVANHATVSYNATLSFSLNDSEYQEKYVTFSNATYELKPDRNILDAGISVSATAPASELELTISISRSLDSSSIFLPITVPISTADPETSLTPSATLLGAGARWAAQNGTSALYIDWLDNYNAHHFSDGVNWGPYWGEDYLSAIKNTTLAALEQQGFAVTCAADLPDNISNYSLVVFEAWFAIEPKDNQIVRDYLTNGGNVVIIGGVPCFFSTYCKDMWPGVTNGENLTSLQDWFGSSLFVNTGGTANLVVNNPLGTSLQTQNKFYFIDAYGCYSLASMSNDSNVLARWSSGSVFAFTHEYGNGRVYYQAALDW